MIDVLTEELISLRDLAARFPRPGLKDKTLHYTTVRRWAETGCRGVKLDVVTVGGRLYTSSAAVQRFVNALAAVKGMPQNLSIDAAIENAISNVRHESNGLPASLAISNGSHPPPGGTGEQAKEADHARVVA